MKKNKFQDRSVSKKISRKYIRKLFCLYNIFDTFLIFCIEVVDNYTL